MKTHERALPIVFLVTIIGCRQEQKDKRTQMMLDSAVSGKAATIVRVREAVRPDESITDFKELSTIMQHDIDALQRIPSKEVVYVRPGQSVRPSEK